MDMIEIENTIQELENGDTTFASCEKLANLYIVRDHLDMQDDVVKEYSDIFTAYTSYCSIKTDYQLGKLSKEAVISEMNRLCKEVYEFLLILYSNSNMSEERELLIDCLNKSVEKIRPI